jgi:dUTP pyrophosphatase
MGESEMIIEVKRTVQASMPVAATLGAAGYDLCASENKIITPSSPILVKTGLSMNIPRGYVGMVCSRSGLALKHGVFVLNAPGIIDSDYRGDIGVILYNSGDVDFEVIAGDRIAQILFVRLAPIGLEEVDSLDETVRGEGGFGSTGVSK